MLQATSVNKAAHVAIDTVTATVKSVLNPKSWNLNLFNEQNEAVVERECEAYLEVQPKYETQYSLMLSI